MSPDNGVAAVEIITGDIRRPKFCLKCI